MLSVYYERLIFFFFLFGGGGGGGGGGGEWCGGGGIGKSANQQEHVQCLLDIGTCNIYYLLKNPSKKNILPYNGNMGIILCCLFGMKQ